ncbi:Lrp/AsnC family transcriptional regulator [Marinomonas algicola]|jgi:Lrp/AsnC family transcriptional regulator, leucine-responsive regulatory protein|uniref:Lrp/AsnC family transcriptional regulator n=1 Tax=Marinomonas algicola TaxID=2773454 RepID=UPI001EFF5CD9|nr:Lrp/AsnC family transcriptional regulator [Marinomonas algicola]
MPNMEIDKTDLNILGILQKEGRLTNVELAEKINLSPSPCLRRVKKLEEQGVITRYKASVARTEVGFTMTIFVDVTLENHRDQASTAFEEAILNMPNVISCFVISGMADYHLEVVVRDLQHYEIILKKIQTLPFVKDIHSNFAIRTIKTDAPLPLLDE